MTTMHHRKLDARQSLTLAHPAILMAACVRSPSCTTSVCAQRPTLHYLSRMLPRHPTHIAETLKLSCVA